MSKFLANENVPASVVRSSRDAGHDVLWIAEETPGISDVAVLDLALRERRVLMTFDKDFGELSFRQGKDASCGILLLRPNMRSPSFVTRFVLNVLDSGMTWEGNFSVAKEGSLRSIPLR